MTTTPPNGARAQALAQLDNIGPKQIITDEAKAWLGGNMSMCNVIPMDPLDTWTVRIAQADAAMVQKAYWILRAYEEGLVRDNKVNPE